MTILHRKQEVNMSIDLNKLMQDKKSHFEIISKQRELEELKQKHTTDDIALQELRAELQQKMKQEEVFEEQKKKARAYMHR